jgi:Ca2+-binding RTX toxin-like protein
MNKSQKSLITTIVVALATSWVAGAPQASAAHSCFGKRATIEGTNRDPRRPVELTGTSGNDVIVGLKGWDIIRGRGGHDLICAGAGDDDIRAGEGNDKVKGQEDFDNLNGGRGNDQMWGGRGAVDALLGGAGNDRLRGGPGHEDSLIGGAGDDVMDGGRGYDLAEFWDSPGGIHADLRSDTAVGYGDDQIVSVEGLVGSNSDDVLFGDELSNLLVGQEGNDEIHAFGSEADGGTDILRSGGGEDLLDGGDGQDTVSYRHSPLPVDADITQAKQSLPGLGSTP